MSKVLRMWDWAVLCLGFSLTLSPSSATFITTLPPPPPLSMVAMLLRPAGFLPWVSLFCGAGK